MREFNNKNDSSPFNEQINKSVIELKDNDVGHNTQVY